MLATFQHIPGKTGILRVHPNGSEGWECRGKYGWCCTMVAKGETMELWGVDELPKLSHLRAIRRYAIENGFTRAMYERHGEWVTWDIVKGRTVQRIK